MNPAVFRENDIRGRAGADIALSEISILGQAIGTYFLERGVRRIVVGRDTRPTSAPWLRELSRGVLSTGCHTIDVGVCPTPCVYFSVGRLQTGGGVMITASHNPSSFNGLKICMGMEPVCGPELQVIRGLVDRATFVRGHGRHDHLDMTEDYASSLADGLTLRRPLRVGVDAGHGAAARAAIHLLTALGAEVVPIRLHPAPVGAAQLLDPAREGSLAVLGRLVTDRDLDVGVAYDGDGDRLGVVGADGVPIGADDLFILFARSVLADHPGATIVAEVRCSQRLFDEIARLGGRAVMWKTGHSLVQCKMRLEKALLAGELSGHFFFADRYLGFDDAIYASGRLLEIVAASSESLVHLLSDLPPMVADPEIRVPCDDETKFGVVDNIARKLREIAAREGAAVVDVDGIRVTWPHGWAVVRASNTEPALVARFEASDREGLESIRSEILGLLQAELQRDPMC